MQIKKITALFMMLAAVASPAFSQSVHGGTLPPLKPVEKTVYDTAYVKVYYEFSYRPDSLSKGRKDGQTILLKGDKAQSFVDYFDDRTDFINDSLAAAKRPPMEAFTMNMGMMKRMAYTYPLVIDRSRNVAIIQVDNMNTYQYTQPVPEISWQTVEGDTTICDVACRKAVCRFGGRDWTAWYAPTFDLHTGPYLFGGLPGLIFSICDTKDNYRFTLNGLENLGKGVPVYLKSGNKILHTTRDKVRKAVENEQADIYKAFQLQNPGAVFTPQAGDTGRRPYNPIELE